MLWISLYIINYIYYVIQLTDQFYAQRYAQFDYFHKKRLTNDITTSILQILAESKVALSSNQIIKKLYEVGGLDEEGEKFVYEILKYLYPDRYDYDRKRASLFNLSNFLNDSSGNYVKLTIRRLAKVLGVNWMLDDELYFDILHDCEFDIQKHQPTKYCALFRDSTLVYLIKYEIISSNRIFIENMNLNQAIIIEWPSLNADDYGEGTISLWHNEDLSKSNILKIICKYNYHKIYFYLAIENKHYRVKYLDAIIKDHIVIDDPIIRDLYEKHYKKYGKVPVSLLVTRMIHDLYYNEKYSNLQNRTNLKNRIEIKFYNSRNWEYRLNLKGLLLFLYLKDRMLFNEYHSLRNIKGKLANSRRNENKRGNYKSRMKKLESRILKNIILNESIQKICPFLLYSSDFMRYGFNVVQILFSIAHEVIPRLDYFEDRKDNLISEISSSQLFTFFPKSHDIYFLWDISKRYYYEFEKYFLERNIDNIYLAVLGKTLIRTVNYKKETTFKLISPTEYKQLYSKVITFRLTMHKILRASVIYERSKLKDEYSIWYKKYLDIVKDKDKDKDKYHQEFEEPQVFNKF